jgi:hypothetical protein
MHTIRTPPACTSAVFFQWPKMGTTFLEHQMFFLWHFAAVGLPHISVEIDRPRVSIIV